MSAKETIGILAYGSLIDDPGSEIYAKKTGVIDCVTPFNIEYAWMSKKRGNAPTLIPVNKGGAPVNAKILIIENVTASEAEDMLWRRETRTSDLSKSYPRKESPSVNDVVIKRLSKFYEIDTVLYTSIGQNIGLPSAHLLAKLAIDSFMAENIQDKMDGVHYLMYARKNGIETPLTLEYENTILKATNSSTLEDAIQTLAIRKPYVLSLKKLKDEFEKEYTEIGELIHNYGLKKTLAGRELPISGEEFKTIIKENKTKFLTNVHEGFKRGQKKIIELLLSFEEQRELLQTEKNKLSGKDNLLKKKVTMATIKQIEYFEDLLRHLIDSIAWQMIRGQLYISRRLYQGVEGKKKLRSSNIQSVIGIADKLNEVPEDFALITDLSSYVQTGDILHLTKGELHIVEVKEGEKNHQVLNIIDKMIKGEKPSPSLFEGVRLDKNFKDQFVRNVKQLDNAQKILQILNNDQGKDKDGKEVKIVTPNEDTPMFDERIRSMEKQLETRNLWAYDVIEDCLHIGMYKGPMKEMGPGILQGIAKINGFEYILMNYRTVVRSLNRPIFTLPISPELLYSILFDRVDLIFMIDLDSYFKLFETYNLSARWLSKKETAKVLQQHKGNQILVSKNRCVIIEDQEKTLTMYLSIGMLQKICFEFIYPSYTAYTVLYYLDIKESKDDK